MELGTELMGNTKEEPDMAYGDERENGLTPMTGEAPRTGGNPQGISDSVATPPNRSLAERDASANPSATETATGGLLSRLSSVPAMTPNAPTLASLTPNAPTVTQQAQQPNAPASPTDGGLVQQYLGRLSGDTPELFNTLKNIDPKILNMRDDAGMTGRQDLFDSGMSVALAATSDDRHIANPQRAFGGNTVGTLFKSFVGDSGGEIQPAGAGTVQMDDDTFADSAMDEFYGQGF